MKYFCSNCERDGSCYHEFQRGKWDGSSHWKADSVLIHDDMMRETGLDLLLTECIPGYNPWGPTEVSLAQWEAVRMRAQQTGGTAAAAADEADEWVRADGATAVFSILGI